MFQIVMILIIGLILIGTLLTILFQPYAHISPRKKAL